MALQNGDENGDASSAKGNVGSKGSRTSICPSFDWSTIQVNKRTPECPPVHFHVHKHNTGKSYIVTLGDFRRRHDERMVGVAGVQSAKKYSATTGSVNKSMPGGKVEAPASRLGHSMPLYSCGGEFIMGDQENRELHDVYRRPFKFDGRRIAHAPAPHAAGVRYSIVWFTQNKQNQSRPRAEKDGAESKP